MKKIIYILLLCVNIILISSIGHTQEVIHWRFQSHHPNGSIPTLYVIPKFIERVRELTQGRLQISLYYAGELVEFEEILPALKDNLIQMSNTSSMFWRDKIPVGWIQLSNLPPFVLRSYNDFEELYYLRGIDTLIGEGLKEHGIYFLGTHSVGNTYLWLDVPISSFNDLKKLKIRFYGSMNDAVKYYGGQSIMLPHLETYDAIKYGILNGSGTAWWIYKDLKLYEVCKYFIGPPWQTPQGMELWVSLKAWEMLPKDIQTAVKIAAQEFKEDYKNIVEKQEREMFNILFPQWGIKYIILNDIEINKMITEFTLPYLDKIIDDVGSFDPRVKQGIEIIKHFMLTKGYIKQ